MPGFGLGIRARNVLIYSKGSSLQTTSEQLVLSTWRGLGVTPSASPLCISHVCVFLSMVYGDYLQWPSLTQHARIPTIVSFHRIIDRCIQVRTNNIANSKPVVVMVATAVSALTSIVLLRVADVADYRQKHVATLSFCLAS